MTESKPLSTHTTQTVTGWGNPMKEICGSKTVSINDGGVSVIKSVPDHAKRILIPEYNNGEGEPNFDVWQELIQKAALNPEIADGILPHGTDIDLAKSINIAATLGSVVKFAEANMDSATSQMSGLCELRSFVDSLVGGMSHPILHHWERSPNRHKKTGGGVDSITPDRIVAEKIILAILKVLKGRDNPLTGKPYTVLAARVRIAGALSTVPGFEKITPNDIKNMPHKWAARLKTIEKCTKSQSAVIVTELINDAIVQLDAHNSTTSELIRTIKSAAYMTLPPNIAFTAILKNNEQNS